MQNKMSEYKLPEKFTILALQKGYTAKTPAKAWGFKLFNDGGLAVEVLDDPSEVIPQMYKVIQVFPDDKVIIGESYAKQYIIPLAVDDTPESKELYLNFLECKRLADGDFFTKGRY